MATVAAEDLTGDGGVLKTLLRAGEGDALPTTGSSVSVHYVGTLNATGEGFDSSRDRGDKFTFKLGVGQVIKAWDVGVASMRRGELALLQCRGDYAYGSSGSPPKIPPDATLNFEVELFDWSGEDLSEAQDGGITREVLTAGRGYDSPKDGAQLELSLRGLLGDQCFDERKVTLECLDEEAGEESVPWGLLHAIKSFKLGERSRIVLAPLYAWGAEGCAALSVPADARVVYEVTLESFTNEREAWELELPERLVQAELYKARGTAHFKAARWTQASSQYQKVVDFLDEEDDEGEKMLATADEEHAAALLALLLSARLNLAAVYVKVEEWADVLAQCAKALVLDAASEKALYREGQAHAALHDHVAAQASFTRCVQVAPGNKAAARELVACSKRAQAEKEREKKMYGAMFG